MRFRKELIIIVIAVLITLLTQGSGSGLCAVQCSDIPTLQFYDLEFGKPIMITSATLVPAGGGLPEHCRVAGTIWPEINFAVKLPTEWNGNFYEPGGGGWNGTIPESAMPYALAKGYACAGTDSGHSGALTTFAYNPPDNSNPNALQKKIDFAYRSYHETATLAKKIIKAYYGRYPRYSYWVGCSEGGRQALIMAQRFPEDFDGIIPGSPLLYLTRKHMFDIWICQALVGDGSISVDQLPLLADAVYKKCDSIDGLVDGLIDDPSKCRFHPAKDLPKCPGPVGSPTCFTIGQIEALQKIYGGVETSWGKLLFPGAPLGAEILAPSNATDTVASGWVGWTIGNPPPTTGQVYGEASMRYISLTPQPGPTWNFPDYNFDTDPPKMEASHILIDATNPNLSPFRRRGGKMIHYHGWADPAINPYSSVNYYESVLELMGEKNTKEFYKLYMIPGMFHCGYGAGCFYRDGTFHGDLYDTIFPALVDWVEKGIEPQAFVGHHTVANTVLRTRPLCPYPEVARYEGRGSIDDAANFTCLEIIPAHVRIEPETLKLGSHGEFTAFITIPRGYHVNNFSVVTCEGALAVKGMFTKKGNSYEAKFNRQDLINITAGETVTFTVTAIFEHRGQKFAFEGSDKVRVIK